MSWLDWLMGKPAPPIPLETLEPVRRRQVEWETALRADTVPGFVAERLVAAAERRTPWVATMTPAELRLAGSHRIRPVAMVSGSCWFQFGGASWSQGPAEGWHRARVRLQQEAALAGANAIVDVRMRRAAIAAEHSMDYTLVGTAVRVDGLPPSTEPIIATVPALEFVRLLEADIVPVGIAVGACFDRFVGDPYLTGTGVFVTRSARRQAAAFWRNQPVAGLATFWDRVRRNALSALRVDANRQGGSVLAPLHFGELSHEGGQDPAYVGHCIAIGTVVDSRPGARARQAITPVMDLRDAPSPLLPRRQGVHAIFHSTAESNSP